MLLTLLAPIAWLLGYAGLVWLMGGAVLGLLMLWLCLKFYKGGESPAARKLFLYTLLYLPLALGLLAISWKQG